jgi:LEA14-like dessication related protein
MRKIALAMPLLLLAGCAGIEKLAASAVQPPKLTFRSATVQELDLEGATLGFTWDLENPNGFGVDVARVAWSVDAEGTRVASGDLPSGLKIRANATAPVTFPVRVRFQDVPGIVKLLTSGKDQVGYKLAASVGVKTPVGVVEVPISHQGHLALPATPHFTLEGIAIRSLSFSEITLDVRVRVQNPNAFPLPLGKLDAALAIAGAPVARAQALDVAPLAKGTSAVVAIPVRLDVGSAGRAAAEVARGGDVEVDLSGKATLGGIPLPLHLAGKVPARR